MKICNEVIVVFWKGDINGSDWLAYGNRNEIYYSNDFHLMKVHIECRCSSANYSCSCLIEANTWRGRATRRRCSDLVECGWSVVGDLCADFSLCSVLCSYLETFPLLCRFISLTILYLPVKFEISIVYFFITGWLFPSFIA